MSAPGSIWQVEAWPPGWTVRHVAETGSTNTDLLAAVDAGTVADRTALVADHQVAGRGRLDRVWNAPSGANLLVSLAIADVPEPPALLTQRVGLATLTACRRAGADVTLKWPNDVLLGGAKVAGILAQRSVATGWVVVGVGLNVGWAPEGAARLIGGGARDESDQSSVSAAVSVAVSVSVSVSGVLCDLLQALDSLPADCADRYRSELGTIGRHVSVYLPDGSTLTGRARDVDATGRLVVEDADGTAHRLDVGDVVHARHTPVHPPVDTPADTPVDTAVAAATNVSSGVPRADEVPPVA